MVKLSSRGWFALTLLFSLSVLIFIFATTFNKQTIVSILSFNLLFLGLAILFRFLALVLWGVRIQLMAGSLGYRVSLPNCVNMVLAGLLPAPSPPGRWETTRYGCTNSTGPE